ncbi:hypothetical protein T492DRAFT_837982 [Pavlovales sp. CCMP2436]|nr:hypothetical protein T492DRAFT_837982 [Pavlovales sp. CCMP2436]|mmetsp:Transcript_30887/g.76144  ORF Transcript_30887/g.76144 Transcript_30887/m.76144 type:complete len:160 (-) Transcript_30887:232-711(-)
MKSSFALAFALALALASARAVHVRPLAARQISVRTVALRRARACPLPLKALENDAAEPTPEAAAAPAAPVAVATPAAPPPKPQASICGTCDGTGRIEGGWGVLPGLKWVSSTFGLRAFRPCPECAKAGRRYQRVGQNLEEVWMGTNRGGASVAPRKPPN